MVDPRIRCVESGQRACHDHAIEKLARSSGFNRLIDEPREFALAVYAIRCCCGVRKVRADALAALRKHERRLGDVRIKTQKGSVLRKRAIVEEYSTYNEERRIAIDTEV